MRFLDCALACLHSPPTCAHLRRCHGGSHPRTILPTPATHRAHRARTCLLRATGLRSLHRLRESPVAKLPDPQAGRLRGPTPDTRIFCAGTSLARVYFATGERPSRWNSFRHWGPATASRFDHRLTRTPNGQGCAQARGVYSCGPSGMTCLAEVFQQTRVIERATGAPSWAAFTLDRDVLLLDLTGEFANRMGARLGILRMAN